MTCPCCKVLRALDEAIKHPSVTSILAARSAAKPIEDGDSEHLERLILGILPCPIHSVPGTWDGFVREFHRKWELAKSVALTSQAHHLLRRRRA
jgi:hypothetical protein